MGKVKDMTGQRFGRLTVLREGNRILDSGYGVAHKARWICRCACGNETVVIGENLRQGCTRSCGCLAAENRRKASRNWVRKAGLRRSPWEQRRVPRSLGIGGKEKDAES